MALPKVEQKVSEAKVPAWYISFADMSLLLLNFFIMMLAMASQNPASEDDMLKMLASIKAGFGYRPEETSEDPMDMAVMQVLSARQQSPVSSQLRWASPQIEGQRFRPRDFADAKGIVGRPILFYERSDQFQVDWESRLDEVAELVRHHHRLVYITGHASNDETEASRERDQAAAALDLGYRRADQVRKALEKRGISPARIRLTTSGFSETTRESPDDLALPEGQDIRRRAVITLGPYFMP